jgi:hypothetical protein
MAGFEPTYELHLRVAGQPHDLTLRGHGEPPSEGDLAAWMQDGRVVGLQVSQTAGRRPHTIVGPHRAGPLPAARTGLPQAVVYADKRDISSDSVDGGPRGLI